MAEKLGVEYVGVEREALEKLVEAKQKELETANPTVKTEVTKVEKKPEVKKEKVEKKLELTTAVVYKDGKYEIRRYTKEIHGEDFESLANQFATKKGCVVVLE